MNSASAAMTVMGAASRATNFANQFMAILAFAIACNGSSSLAFSVPCTNTTISPKPAYYQADYSYPYSVSSSKLYMTQNCVPSSYNPDIGRTTITTSWTGNIAASSQFFVFTGVMAFLYSLVFLVIYVFFKHKYENFIYLPLIDFASTSLFVLFWFAGSIAWAQAISNIQNYTNPDNLIDDLKVCEKNNCQGLLYPGYANIIISCILGFGNLILWSGNTWFVLKETTWYKTRKQLQQQQQNMTNNPISPSNVHISAQYSANNKI